MHLLMSFKGQDIHLKALASIPRIVAGQASTLYDDFGPKLKQRYGLS